MRALFMLLIFFAGACAGSFVNCLTRNAKAGDKIFSFKLGDSYCGSCENRFSPYEMLPVLNRLILRKRRGRCGADISMYEPLIELLVGALAVLAARTYGCTFLALLFFLILIALTTISVYDIKYMLILDEFVAALLALSVVYAVLLGSSGVSIISRLAGMFALSLPMFALAMLIEGAFGGGDIKLIAVCGFLLGVKLILLAGFIAIVLGGIAGVYLKYIKRGKSITHMAFGQYICAGVLIAMLFGDEILNRYFMLLMLGA